MGFEQIDNFINQLLNSNAIKNLPPHEKEDNVLTFLSQNEEKLKATFASANYLPDQPWQNVKAEFVTRLGAIITEQVKPSLNKLIFDSLSLEWKAKYIDFLISDIDFRNKLYTLCEKLVSRYNSRKHYAGIINFINNDVLPQFIMSVYDNRRYICNGLVRFDDVSLDTPELAIDFFYTAMLFLPLYDITLPKKVIMPQYNGPMGKAVAFPEVENNAILRQNFIAKIKEIILKEFPDISPYFLKIILKTFYVPEEAEDVPYCAKVLRIIYGFATQWRKIKKDRGAESFEASWFNVARINHKFYAYDLGTLDEFYKITIEEDL
jgi:hypothetical protein